MAGMLPGVECARRRRIHQTGGFSDSPALAAHNSTRRSSFCLYTSNHESLNSSSLLQRSNIYQAHRDEKLEEAAREAKERLDEKFRGKRQNSKEKLRCMEMEGRPSVLAELHIETYGSKKSGTRKFSWTKLSWKASEQEDCAVCLESFKVGETLIHIPCAHRFHSRCLEPWLERNTYCPCCRMSISPS